jgi:hypothetical protein
MSATPEELSLADDGPPIDEPIKRVITRFFYGLRGYRAEGMVNFRFQRIGLSL